MRSQSLMTLRILKMWQPNYSHHSAICFANTVRNVFFFIIKSRLLIPEVKPKKKKKNWIYRRRMLIQSILISESWWNSRAVVGWEKCVREINSSIHLVIHVSYTQKKTCAKLYISSWIIWKTVARSILFMWVKYRRQSSPNFKTPKNFSKLCQYIL